MLLSFSNLQVKHWNPGASMPLILPVHLICNTPDEQLHENIKENSRRPGRWIKVEEPHDRIAVLCGSGPSLEDTLEEVRGWADRGATIFAMNGSAKFLNDRGILPDFQVIIDPRPITAELVGPAKGHLFASQVHPSCFEKAPAARVWHLQIENIDDSLPEYPDSFAYIGGGASVGNTATCLAYAMGYRMLHIYGYDSCHREGKGHAFHQAINEGDPCASVRFLGRDYIASLTMKLQAEKFVHTSQALKEAGCRLEVHGSGLLPDIYRAVTGPMTEKRKYELMWMSPEYREVAPGEVAAELFIQQCKVGPEARVVDFGAGTGRGAAKIKEMAGCSVLMVDFVENCLDPDVRELNLPFVLADLTEELPPTVQGTIGYCTDVMEHIPSADTRKVLSNIMSRVPECFFNISTVADGGGDLIGHALHLVVKKHDWWKALLEEMGFFIVWELDNKISSFFHVRRG